MLPFLVSVACAGSASAPGSSSAGGAGSGGALTLGGSSGSLQFEPSGGSGGETDFVECHADESDAVSTGVDMYVILDHSNSMSEGMTADVSPDCPLDLSSAPASSSKWCYATHALGRYFTSAAARRNRAALQFMAAPGFRCEGGPDNGHATPAVAMLDLPVATESELLTALDGETPSDTLMGAVVGTTIESALRGIVTYTTHFDRSAGRPLIGLLITDGNPTQCDTIVRNLARIASDHRDATGIRTFIVGMTGATLTNLEVLAVAGGAPEHGPDFCGEGVEACHYFTVGDGDPNAFVDALEQIQQAASLPCVYALPELGGSRLDSDLVQVVYRTRLGEATELPRAASAQACDAAGGWYYDDPASPQNINLCPTSCEAATLTEAGGSIKIRYGCRPVVK